MRDTSFNSVRKVRSRRAIGSCELMVLFGAASIVVSALLPQLVSLREASRRIGCHNNLIQIGKAMDSYHDRHLSLPPGYFPSDYKVNVDKSVTWEADIPAYGWAAFLLADLGHGDLYRQLGVSNAALPAVAADERLRAAIQTIVPEYRCGSDRLGVAMDSAPLPPYHQSLSRSHRRVFGGAASYVANSGYFELNHPTYLAPPSKWTEQYQRKTGPNNGLFYTASQLHRRQITDGLSHTIAVGERAWYQGGASWVGTANVRGVHVGSSGVCLGRVWWRINEVPQSMTSLSTGQPPILVTPENRLTVGYANSARNGFGSYHPKGANFLLADGSVRFIDDQIDFANTIPSEGANPLDPIPDVESLGVFQQLGIRNDTIHRTTTSSEAPR